MAQIVVADWLARCIYAVLDGNGKDGLRLRGEDWRTTPLTSCIDPTLGLRRAAFVADIVFTSVAALRQCIMLPTPQTNWRTAIFMASACTALIGTAAADASRDEQIAERFAAADTNHDGQLTLAEARAGMPRVAANFNKIDTDQSGTVTLAEIKAMADR